eukprot:COSAG06_NODE_827_length_12062_cov_46.356182_9_plen_207_part_00
MASPVVFLGVAVECARRAHVAWRRRRVAVLIGVMQTLVAPIAAMDSTALTDAALMAVNIEQLVRDAATAAVEAMLGADLIPDEAWMQLDLDGAVAATVVGVAAVAAGSVGAAAAMVGVAWVDGPAAQGNKKARASGGTSPDAPPALGGARRGGGGGEMAEWLGTPLSSANENELGGVVTQNGKAIDSLLLRSVNRPSEMRSVGAKY